MNKGVLSEVSTVTKGENSTSTPPLYPSHHHLILPDGVTAMEGDAAMDMKNTTIN
jgi:hypothetical protein